MKFGYSILLGETLDAGVVQYKDCERFQIVCPECREPVFKVRRGADTTDERHYLAHYSAAESYQGQCELRVGKFVRAQIDKDNQVSRDQRLAFFLSVLRRTVGMDPLYSRPADKLHWEVNKAPAIILLRDHVWTQVAQPGGVELFDGGAKDYLWNIDDTGWAMTTTFSLERQRQIARDMWLTIVTPSGRSNYNFLWNHGFLRELNKILVTLECGPVNSDIEREVMERHVSYMGMLLKSKKHDSKLVIDEMSSAYLPDSFNIIHGTPDTSGDRSTYLTRMLANITIEMIGTLLELPYFELLKQQYADPGKIYPYKPGIEPIDADEIARLESWREMHHIKGRSTH